MNLHWNRRKCFCLLAAAAILTTLAVVRHAAQKPRKAPLPKPD